VSAKRNRRDPHPSVGLPETQRPSRERTLRSLWVSSWLTNSDIATRQATRLNPAPLSERPRSRTCGKLTFACGRLCRSPSVVAGALAVALGNLNDDYGLHRAFNAALPDYDPSAAQLDLAQRLYDHYASSGLVNGADTLPSTARFHGSDHVVDFTTGQTVGRHAYRSDPPARRGTRSLPLGDLPLRHRRA
jgi:hypothetical protein